MTIKDYQKNEDKKKQALSYFVSKGYTPEAASGIVGNLVHESNLNTVAEGDKGYKGGSSFGLAQWRGDRLKRLKKAYGENWIDFNNQLEFVDWELNNTHKNAGEMLRKSKNIHDAGRVFSDYYEIPQKKYNENKGRQLDVTNVASLIGQTTSENQTESTYVPPTQTTTIVQNLPKSEQSINFAEETKKLEQQSKEKEAAFLQEYQSAFTPEQPQETVEEQQMQLPQTNLIDIFNQVNQFVDEPLMAQSGGKYKVKDERGESLATRDNVLPQIKDKKLILQQIDLENKDKEEYQKTGIIKAPRSLAYKKQAAELQSRMTNVSQDKLTPKKRAEYNDAMDKVQNESLGIGDRPLIYLADPSKILGDLGVKGFNTSEEDRQKINLNRYNPTQSGNERFKNNLEMGLGYVPEASLNLALSSLAVGANPSLLKIAGEAYNPIPLPFKKGQKVNPDLIYKEIENTSDAVNLQESFSKNNIIDGIDSFLDDFNPKNFKARDGEQWIKDWYNSPEILKRAEKYDTEGVNLKGKTKILLAQEDLENYTDKTYRDLIKDKGLAAGLKQFIRSGGASYGVPENIYVKSQPHFGLNRKARESVKVHELTHLAEKNGYRFNEKENDALLEPFGYKTKEIFETDKTPLEVLGSRDKTYYVDPTEIHARMNEARYQFGLKPEYKFTTEDFDEVTEANNWFGMGKYIKDKDAFVKLMNNFYVAAPVVGTVAAANKENKQQGGIPISSKGQYEYPNQKVIVPSTRITMKDIPNYILAITDEGDKKILEPEKEYKLKGNSTLEIPLTEAEKNFLKELKF